MKSWEPISVIADGVANGQKTAIELVEKSLKIIESNEEFKAIISVLRESALARAQKVDEAIKSGKKPGRLSGVPFIAKDNFLVFGAETTAASNMLKGFQAPYQSTAINKLEAEGAICVAKANLDAFAHGSSTENSDFFTTKNPHDKSKVPGGSSGGSATAVALEMAPFALGTDTGGSIRQPASFCGVVGYKPTYGLVSRSGVVAMGSSLDVIGPITNSTEDTCLVLDVIAGKDELDGTTIDRDKSSYADLKKVDLKNLKIGVVKEHMSEGLDKNVKDKVSESIELLKKQGAKVEEVSLPSLPLALACYYIICPAELSSNLGRYDGQRYQHSDEGAKNLDESYVQSRSNGFGVEAKRRIMIGAYVLSSGYYDAYYNRAQLVRTKIINELNDSFKKYDILIGPTTPTTAFKIGENVEDPLHMYLSDVMTVGANLAGIPAINIFGGKAGGMPIGLQLMAAQSNDRELLSIAKSIEEIIQ
jgi:aspartyl-tRNA(Asn)/glutamyl-tRNA(Gln) amidotransferase subunit A